MTITLFFLFLFILRLVDLKTALWIAIALFIDPGGYINKYFDLPEIRFLLPFFIAFVPYITDSRYRIKLNFNYYKPIRLFYPFLFYISNLSLFFENFYLKKYTTPPQ